MGASRGLKIIFTGCSVLILRLKMQYREGSVKARGVQGLVKHYPES